jgi:hypothetical protein
MISSCSEQKSNNRSGCTTILALVLCENAPSTTGCGKQRLHRAEWYGNTVERMGHMLRYIAVGIGESEMTKIRTHIGATRGRTYNHTRRSIEMRPRRASRLLLIIAGVLRVRVVTEIAVVHSSFLILRVFGDEIRHVGLLHKELRVFAR